LSFKGDSPVKTLLFVALSAAALGASAAEPRAGASTARSSTLSQERAACDNPGVEDRKACLREAGAAAYEARRGTLGQENTDFERNNLARCSYHKIAEDREYCERRMRGEGTVSGSVQGGGLLRELTVTVPAEQATR
jgi:hypothetical protein